MKISKAEYDALPEGVKSLFTENGEGFISQTEADKGLKEANDKLLSELKQKGDVLKQFEGLDANAAKIALDQMKKVEEKKLLDKQKFDEVLETYKTEYEGKLTAASSEKEQLLSNLKRERLTNFLVEKGVLPDRAKFALTEIGDGVELESNENGFTLKKSGGIGDVKEMDALVEGLKQNSAFLFKAETASGSGASGSNSSGGGSGQNLYGQDRMANAYESNTT